jgi:uncharacterized protein (DUF1800 family)
MVQIVAELPAGYRYAVVESRDQLGSGQEGEILVAGALEGAGGAAWFKIPEPESTRFLFIRLVNDDVPPQPQHEGPEYFSFNGEIPVHVIGVEQRAGHLLNRIAYGPTLDDLQKIDEMGITGYIDWQLHPDLIPENQFFVLNNGESELFEEYQPSRDTVLVPRFSTWSYRKGITAPPSDWMHPDFDDSGWEQGQAGFGYGDGDDNTVFRDMRQTDTNPDGYLTFAIRRKFALFSPDEISRLILRINFDDAFVAYLNGEEVARANVSGARPGHLTEADGNHEAGEFEEFDITDHRNVLVDGVNVIAIQLHNYRVTSSDATLVPELLIRESIDADPVQRISGIDELQQLIHVRGVYAPNQLQAILGEFWENHFTTDFDKVAAYFEDLENSDGSEAMSRQQARSEAAHEEFKEYQFFYEHALGRFEDLLMFSATSVPQLIYLDNVTNTRSGPNENYAREILELFAFGVDNRYTQSDIEELARCFTGWTVRKVWPQDLKQWPDSAVRPFTETNVSFRETPVIALGDAWRYVKGTLEPTPDAQGNPTTLWTRPGYNDARWATGRTSIGYGDGDDLTELADMRNNYSSVYLRRTFTLESPQELRDLVLAIDYDDGFVAYLNGTEIARSESMEMTGNPPPHDSFASRNHESRGNFETYPMALFADLIRFGAQPNVLAIQAHNVSLRSSDFSIHPKLVHRELEEGSIENGDPNGEWAFRFSPEDHDIDEKILFRDTEWEMVIPAGRTGIDGLKDAQDVIRMMAGHVSTREFICIKLINRFVSDDITLENYHDGTAPEPLVELLHQCMDVWTESDGMILEVMKVILDPERQSSPFWSRDFYRAKVKTPVEFINSTLRALNGRLIRPTLPDFNDKMGMHLFTRDDPNGWSEYGIDWISTSSLLERINFVQSFATNSDRSASWNYLTLLRLSGARTAEEIVRYLDGYLFQGTLGEENIQLLVHYAETDDNGEPLPLEPGNSDYASRVRELIGLVLSAPHWHYQ